MDRTLTVLVVLAVVVAGVPPESVGSVSAAPSGFVGVPAENVDEDVRGDYDGALTAAALEGEVLASSNASTLEVIVVTSEKAPKYQYSSKHSGNLITGDDAGLVLRDDVHHAGRDVGLPVDVIEAQVGYVPESVHGLHENGSRWTSETRVDDGVLIFEVPHFSTQTVAFESEVRLQGTESADGSQWSYNVSNEEAVNNVTVDVTGVDSTEVDTVSGAGLANGGTLALDVAGTDPATGVSATLTGSGFARWDNQSKAGVAPTSSHTLPIDGNLEPTDGAGGDPVLEVTSHEPTYESNALSSTAGTSHGFIGESGGGYKFDTGVEITPSYSGKVEEIDVNIDSVSGSDYGPTVDVYINAGESDMTFAEGTKIATWDPAWSTGTQTIQIDSPPSVSKGTKYTIEFVTSSKNANGDGDNLKLATNSVSHYAMASAVDGQVTEEGDLTIREEKTVGSIGATDDLGNDVLFGDLADGQTASKRIDLKSTSSSLDFNASGDGSIDYTLTMQEREGSEDPSMDLDGDGTADVSHTGVLLDGETTTSTAADLAVGSGPASVSLTSGTVDASVTYTEHTTTQNVDWVINGNATTHTGSIAPGNTVRLDPPDSDVKAGTNDVTVRIAQGLSADAPVGKATVDYTHDAERTFSASRSDNKWVETYNVSQTLASDRESVTATLPFSASTIAVGSVETRTNGGSWSEVPASSYSLEGTDLVVDTGSALEGDTVDVRAEARRVQVVNGAISVEEPTVEGDSLNTLIKVTDRSEGFRIDVANTSTRVHYLHSASWTENAFVAVDAAGKQELYLPDANVGSTTRVRTVPLEVSPEAGAIEVDVVDAEEPRFALRQGATSGADDVVVTYHDTISGEDYELYSVTRERVVGTDTAQSPVFFRTTGDDETYLIQFAEKGTAAVGIGGSGGESSSPLGILALFAGLTVAILGVVFAGRRFIGLRGRRETTVLLVVGTVVGTVGVEAVTPRSIIGDILFALGDVGRGALATGVGTVVIGFVMVLGLYLLRERTPVPVPRLMYYGGIAGVAIWTIDDVLGGALATGLAEVSSTVWIFGTIGAIVVAWRIFQPTVINIGGEEQ